jgi:AcrR family transcriptional regulator
MPKPNKDEIVRLAILQAAERVFQKWGLNKTTMKNIADEAGKGKSTLYYYYKSKEEIFDAVVMAELEAVLSIAKEATRTAASAKEKLTKYIVTLLCEFRKKASLYTIVREEIRRNRNFIEKFRSYLEAKEERFIRELLRSGVKNNGFRSINERNLNTAARTIVGMMYAMELYLLLENDDLKQVDMAAKLIANGI